MYYYDKLTGLLFILFGGILLMFAIGNLIFRIMIGLFGLSLINYGLKLYGLPPMQFLFPIFLNKRWF